MDGSGRSLMAFLARRAARFRGPERLVGGTAGRMPYGGSEYHTSHPPVNRPGPLVQAGRPSARSLRRQRRPPGSLRRAAIPSWGLDVAGVSCPAMGGADIQFLEVAPAKSLPATSFPLPAGCLFFGAPRCPVFKRKQSWCQPQILLPRVANPSRDRKLRLADPRRGKQGWLQGLPGVGKRCRVDGLPSPSAAVLPCFTNLRYGESPQPTHNRLDAPSARW